MAVPVDHLMFMWREVVGPRLGDPYVWGGSFDPNNPLHGTDCSGAVSECLEALVNGRNMNWHRQFWTGTFSSARPGDVGPFGGVTVTKDLVCIESPYAAPDDAAMVIAIRQLPDPTDAHMVCSVDGCMIESGGSAGGFHIGKPSTNIDDPMFNQWFYLPGPFVGKKDKMPYTLYADVSEWQVPVDDSYPYSVFCFRVCDGTYEDHNFYQNYEWTRKALDNGDLTFAIIYTFVRAATWRSNVATVKRMIEEAGGLHPKCSIMLDVESLGCHGDCSFEINSMYRELGDWAGSRKRIIGYGNVSDLNTCWPDKPKGIGLVVASYGDNPPYPGKIAHQYTNGQGWGGGLPEGAPPFGRCDMNSADGATAKKFAKQCGIKLGVPRVTPGRGKGESVRIPKLSDSQRILQTWQQLRGPTGHGWPQLGQNDQGQDLTVVDALADLMDQISVISAQVDEIQSATTQKKEGE